MSRRRRCPTRLAVVAKATATHLRQVQRVRLNVRERRERLKRRVLRRGEREADGSEHGQTRKKSPEKLPFWVSFDFPGGVKVPSTAGVPGRGKQMFPTPEQGEKDFFVPARGANII